MFIHFDSATSSSPAPHWFSAYSCLESEPVTIETTLKDKVEERGRDAAAYTGLGGGSELVMLQPVIGCRPPVIPPTPLCRNYHHLCCITRDWCWCCYICVYWVIVKRCCGPRTLLECSWKEQRRNVIPYSAGGKTSRKMSCLEAGTGQIKEEDNFWGKLLDLEGRYWQSWNEEKNHNGMFLGWGLIVEYAFQLD